MADIFLFAGIFYFIYRYLAGGKGWFFILLPGLFFFRDVNYAQELFLIFIVFASLGFKNNFSFAFETIYCSLSGVLLFFMLELSIPVAVFPAPAPSLVIMNFLRSLESWLNLVFMEWDVNN